MSVTIESSWENERLKDRIAALLADNSGASCSHCL